MKTHQEIVERLEHSRKIARTDFTESQNQRLFGYNDCIMDMKAILPSILKTRDQEIITLLEDLLTRKEQVHGFQGYGNLEGDQEEAQKRIYFDGYADGRNLLKIDLQNLVKKIK